GLEGGEKAAAFVLAALADSDDETRQAAVAAAGRLRLRKAVGALETALADKSNAPLRREAFLALAALETTSAASAAKEFLGGKDALAQREAVRLLGATPTGAREAGQLLLAGKLPRRLLAQVTAALRRHADSDAEAARLLEQ